MTLPADILDFWYSDDMREKWFHATQALDAMIKEKYEDVWLAAACGELDAWRTSPEGCLALTIILDQFPLNMFRGTPKSFASESKSRDVARHAIEQGYDTQIDAAHLAFLYMPFMHSEIVRRFGRFPHRNAILGRVSTPQELAYLNSKDAFKG